MPHVEVWLRGPVPDIPALLQPVAHALLQCREELTANLMGLAPEQVWERPNGAASIGFHARHAAGSLDGLFTYARNVRSVCLQADPVTVRLKPDTTYDRED